MLLNLETDLDREYAAKVGAKTLVPAVKSEGKVTIKSPEIQSKSHLISSGADWTASQLQDYVLAEIKRIHGDVPTGPQYKANAIFGSFVKRYTGKLAEQIARYAFEVEGGWWFGAPITMTRFCKASDNFFSDPILDRLDSTPHPVTI